MTIEIMFYNSVSLDWCDAHSMFSFLKHCPCHWFCLLDKKPNTLEPGLVTLNSKTLSRFIAYIVQLTNLTVTHWASPKHKRNSAFGSSLFQSTKNNSIPNPDAVYYAVVKLCFVASRNERWDILTVIQEPLISICSSMPSRDRYLS